MSRSRSAAKAPHPRTLGPVFLQPPSPASLEDRSLACGATRKGGGGAVSWPLASLCPSPYHSPSQFGWLQICKKFKLTCLQWIFCGCLGVGRCPNSAQAIQSPSQQLVGNQGWCWALPRPGLGGSHMPGQLLHRAHGPAPGSFSHAGLNAPVLWPTFGAGAWEGGANTGAQTCWGRGAVAWTGPGRIRICRVPPEAGTLRTTQCKAGGEEYRPHPWCQGWPGGCDAAGNKGAQPPLGRAARGSTLLSFCVCPFSLSLSSSSLLTPQVPALPQLPLAD